MQQAIQPTTSEPVGHPLTVHAVHESILPAPAEYLAPSLDRPFTNAEKTALRRFIALLPVSPQLDRATLSVLRSFVAPFYVCGQPERRVSAETLQQRLNAAAEGKRSPFSLDDIKQALASIFALTNTLTIGQLDVERDAATNSLVLRLNADNYNALLDFIIMLVGEDLI